MIRIAWVTGRAAAGKTTVIAACVSQLRAQGLQPVVLSDERLLFRLKEADVEHRHHYHPHGDDRFVFRDGYLFDEGLRQINARLVEAITSSSPDIVLVELARGQTTAVVDVSYQRALALVDSQVWAHSLVFRLEVPYRIQVERNRTRAVDKGGATPDEIMRDLYAHDDPESLTVAGITISTIPPRMSAWQAAAIILDKVGVEVVETRRPRRAAEVEEHIIPAVG